MVVNKKVKMSLDGVDGNAFSIMGFFSSTAKRQGWKHSEIKAVLDEARSGDYVHLLATICNHIEEEDFDHCYDYGGES